MSSTAQLHQIIAVEGDLQGKAKRVLEEAGATFKAKPHLFLGSVRTLELFTAESDIEKLRLEESEKKQEILSTTVPDKLGYIWESVINYWNVLGQKERTNQAANADLVIDGLTVLTNVPATLLLGLESRLLAVRAVYEAIPTLEPNIDWKEAVDIGANVRVAPETTSMKSQKTTEYKTIAPATDKHPAQNVAIEKNTNLGAYKLTKYSGMITPAEKSLWLGRIDKLIQGTKRARQVANSQPVVAFDGASALRDFIHAQDPAQTKLAIQGTAVVTA